MSAAGPMEALGAAYLRLMRALAVAGAAILGAIALLIAADVILRNLGVQPPAHTLALTEYGLYYATLLAAPWLVRTGGHVQVEMLTGAVPAAARVWFGRAAAAICLFVCLAMALLSLEVARDDLARGVFDMRSFDMPKWLLTGAVAPVFLMMAFEFARLIRAGDRAEEAEPGLGM